MSWFKNNKRSQPAAYPQKGIPTFFLAGNLPCSHIGCTATNGVRCSYVDRHQQFCHTSWCPEHQIIIYKQCFCRRHANTLDAIGHSAGLEIEYPDVSNRVPSLVRWMTLQSNHKIKNILETFRHASEKFSHIPIHSVARVDGTVQWQCSWQLFSHTGPTLIVTIYVAEHNPTTIVVRVDNKTVFSEIPPWIIHHEEQEQVDHKIDTSERELFLANLLDAIEEELASQRPNPKV